MSKFDDPSLTDLGNDLRDSFYQMITDTLVLEERAAWGAVDLDRAYPLTYPGEDWVKHIDQGSLDMSSGDLCIIGQLYGPWDEEFASIARTLDQVPHDRVLTYADAERIAVLHGLFIDERDLSTIMTVHDIQMPREPLRAYAYRRLTKAWLHEIAARLEA